MNGRKFKCLKFRSMVINSKEVLEEVLRTDPIAVRNGIKISNSKMIHVLLKWATSSVKQASMSSLSSGTWCAVI